MDRPVFEAMLKTALEEALKEDMKELEKVPAVPESRRHQKRMKKMLEDPWGYERCTKTTQDNVRRFRPARWAAAIAVIALLTGTAAGYALRGGEFFRDMFDTSPWAAHFGAAANTEQLLEMGGESIGAVVEDENVRFEIVDVVSDGQFAMVSVHMSLLDHSVRRALEKKFPDFEHVDICPLDAEADALTGMGFGFSTRGWLEQERPVDGEYQLVFSIEDSALAEGGAYQIQLQDLGLYSESGYETYVSGTWVLEVELHPGEVQEYKPDVTCQIAGADWTLEELAVSPLAVTMKFQAQEETDIFGTGIYKSLDISLKLENGRVLGKEAFVCNVGSSREHLEVLLESQMPMDVEQIVSVSVSGEEIFLDK